MPVGPLVASRLADRDSNHLASADSPGASPYCVWSTHAYSLAAHKAIHLETFMSSLIVENQYQKNIKTFLFNNLINIPLTKPQTPC